MSGPDAAIPRGPVLVVGGAGYVGSHSVRALRAAGVDVTVFDDLSMGHAAAVPDDVELVRGDVRDGAALDALLERLSPSGVLHFAALAVVGESVRDPAPTYDVNVNGTRTLLEALARHDRPPLVFSSTCAVYGEPRGAVLDERHPHDPVSPYGRSKLHVEHMLQDFDAAYGQRFSALRYFNAAGSAADGSLGEDHRPESHLIPIVLDVAMGRRERLTIHGDDWDTPDGTCIRDFVHVDDLADAHLRALRRLQDGGSSAAINLGTGTGSSVREVVQAVERATGAGVACDVGPRRPGDPARLVAEPALAWAELGWSPRRDLHTCVRDALSFRGTHPDGYATATRSGAGGPTGAAR